MGIVVHLPRRIHARASAKSRAAKAAKVSADTIADRARDVSRIDSHHSGGIRSLCHHFETAVEDAPMSAASSSLVGQSSISALKEGTGVGVSMARRLGQMDLNVKGDMALDVENESGHNDLMAKDPLKQYLAEFGSRLREVRGKRTTTTIAKALGTDQSAYSKWENGRREMPLHLVHDFCELFNVDPGWLIHGTRRQQKFDAS